MGFFVVLILFLIGEFDILLYFVNILSLNFLMERVIVYMYDLFYNLFFYKIM